jgi:hypothetical protein
MFGDSLLFDAGFVFFAAWSLMLAALVLTAFGGDILPSKAQIDAAQKAHGSNQLSR